MARSNKKLTENDFVVFNVVYEDGTLSSNRKVPLTGIESESDLLGAKAVIEAQDRDIAEKSGRPRGRVKTLERVKAKKK